MLAATSTVDEETQYSHVSTTAGGSVAYFDSRAFENKSAQNTVMG